MSELDRIFHTLARNAIGFDRLTNRLSTISNEGYPPYNIIRSSDQQYIIEIAVAGFKPVDIEIEQLDRILKIRSLKSTEQRNVKYIHQGISKRIINLTFELAEYVEVVNAKFEDGLLQVVLRQEIPERMQPRIIPITVVEALEPTPWTQTVVSP